MYNTDNFSFDDLSGVLPVFSTQVHDQFKFMRVLYIFSSEPIAFIVQNCFFLIYEIIKKIRLYDFSTDCSASSSDLII